METNEQRLFQNLLEDIVEATNKQPLVEDLTEAVDDATRLIIRGVQRTYALWENDDIQGLPPRWRCVFCNKAIPNTDEHGNSLYGMRDIPHDKNCAWLIASRLPKEP